MRRVIVKAMLLALLAVMPTPVFAADIDFVPGQERIVTRYSACLGDRHSPVCALEIAFACAMREDDENRETCRRIGGAPDPDCRPIRTMGVRYTIAAIYGIDKPGAWSPVLPTLSEGHRYARIVFRAGFCRASHDCFQPDVTVYGDVEKVGEEWAFADANRPAWRQHPYMHQQVCEASSDRL